MDEPLSISGKAREVGKAIGDAVAGAINQAHKSAIEKAVAAERERCAVVVESGYCGMNEPVPPRQLRIDIASKIRSGI